MHLHELFCNTQTKPQPTLAEPKIARRMAAGIELREKRLEQVAQLLRFQADAAIVHHDFRDVGLAQSRRQLDGAAVGSELDRVGQQVDQDRADLVGVNFKCAQVIRQPRLELDVASVREEPDLVGDPVDQVGQIRPVCVPAFFGNPRREARSVCS